MANELSCFRGWPAVASVRATSQAIVSRIHKQFTAALEKNRRSIALARQGVFINHQDQMNDQSRLYRNIIEFSVMTFLTVMHAEDQISSPCPCPRASYMSRNKRISHSG